MSGKTALQRWWRRRREDREARRLILQSGLFDRDYYLRSNPDVAGAGIDPLRHYIRRGRREGRAPSLYFDPNFYLASNPDVRQADLDPVVHYIRHGHAEGRPAQSPRQLIVDSGLFDANYYRNANVDVALSGQDPLEHYINCGRREGRSPSVEFDPFIYLSNSPDLQGKDIEPIIHYIKHGRAEGRVCKSPGLDRQQLPKVLAQIRSSGVFDDEYYLRRCPGVREAGIDPLLHYVIDGFRHYIDPSAAISTIQYIVSHPQARTTGPVPLFQLNSAIVTNNGGGLPIADPSYTSAEESPRKPDRSIAIERMAGVAYFHGFLFPFHSVDTACKYVSEAVAELVCRSPELKIERIEPDVSIIVPVYGQLHFVLNCLDSLSRQRSRFSAEIIVADDSSPESSETWRLQAIPWIRYRLHEPNGGFLDTCNDVARLARGRFLVFLNSDTRVAEGWLDELIDSFTTFPKAGLIGSTLFNADGSLQEAGGIYWRDGSAWNYGHNDDPNHPKYCFARQADYVSGAAIAVPTEIWNRMGGFDVAYRPAYCEDADLAFRLREAAYEVWLQPLSRVLHYEGKTHGRDLEKGVKAHQTVNMRQFAKRWKAALAAHRPNGHSPDQEANRAARDRILVLDATTPTPDQDSGSFITFRILMALRKLGYQITFVPQHNYAYNATYTTPLQRLGIECLYFPYFRNITDVLDFRSDFDIVLGYRFNVLDKVYDEIRRRVPAARIIFHNVDLHYLREEREAALEGSRSKKIAAAVTKAAELELIAKVDCTIVHTPVEAAIIKKELPIDHIVVFPYIADIYRTQIAFEERYNILFLGGFGHPPNTDAVKHFLRSIWPSLLERLPEQARFVIVGASPPESVKALAGSRVIVAGYAEDLQPHFDAARVFVAPIRYGAGIKGKVIQTLCYGTPSVVTSIAAEGIGLASGKETIIADDDEEFIKQTLHLYSDRALWHQLQAAGYEFVEQNFSWKRCFDLCNTVFDTADATWLSRHERMLRSRLKELVAGPDSTDSRLAKFEATCAR